MKIAVLAPPYLPVPPIGYGGVEKVIYCLTEGLAKKGHEVTLFASGDSKTSAILSSTFPQAIGNSGEIKNKPILPLLQYIDCFSRSSEFDLIHNHAEHLAMFLADLVKTPVVHTMHSTLVEEETIPEKRLALQRFKNHNFVSISDSQKEGLPDLNWIGTVYNGVNLADFPFSPAKGDYLLWLGRVTRKKGPLEAIKVAKTLAMKLKMVGVVDPVEKDFFENEVKPLVDGKEIEFIGELDKEKIAEVYSHAYCTLYPISWHEPFGLVMIESMATGTPVVAYNFGSVPEIIKDGKTGFVVKDADKMIEAVKKAGQIKRIDCRKRVEDKFSAERMVEGYEKVYKKVIASSV